MGNTAVSHVDLCSLPVAAPEQVELLPSSVVVPHLVLVWQNSADTDKACKLLAVT